MLDRRNKLLLVLSIVFLSNALLAEFIGVKIFSLESTLGLKPIQWLLPNFNLTAGVVLWPIVFIMTDIINEYFGKKGVQFLSYAAVLAISFSFVVIFVAIRLDPASFWIDSYAEKGVDNMQSAYRAVFGQGIWIIMGSLVAFLIGQFLDVMVFQRIKKKTGEKLLWLRATGSTLISQFVDSFVVLFIAFYISGIMDLQTVLAIGLVNYIFKFFVAIILTPVLYLVHYWIDNYLGEKLATQLKEEAKHE